TAAAKAPGRGLPIVAQVNFGGDAHAHGGLAPAEVARRLVAAGADVIGANCGAGPPELFEVGVGMLEAGAPVSLQPNAGLPRVIDGRTIYIANPERFGVWARRVLQAGVRIVGGCCGTTREHTRRMLGGVRMIGARPLPTRIQGGEARPKSVRPAGKPPVPQPERSRLAKKLAEGRVAGSRPLSSPPGGRPPATPRAARPARARAAP